MSSTAQEVRIFVVRPTVAGRSDATALSSSTRHCGAPMAVFEHERATEPRTRLDLPRRRLLCDTSGPSPIRGPTPCSPRRSRSFRRAPAPQEGNTPTKWRRLLRFDWSHGRYIGDASLLRSDLRGSRCRGIPARELPVGTDAVGGYAAVPRKLKIASASAGAAAVFSSAAVRSPSGAPTQPTVTELWTPSHPSTASVRLLIRLPGPTQFKAQSSTSICSSSAGAQGAYARQGSHRATARG